MQVGVGWLVLNINRSIGYIIITPRIPISQSSSSRLESEATLGSYQDTTFVFIKSGEIDQLCSTLCETYQVKMKQAMMDAS